MSKFFVGQRVRLARPDQPKNYGVTGFIFYLGEIKFGQLFNGERCEDANCAVRWDHGDWSVQYTHQLEPILPDGHRAGEEGRCELLDALLERQREVA